MKKLILIFSISISSIILSGQIINIPDDFETIQLGINAASNGDTILVDTGIYTENINFSGKNIKLVSHFIFTMDTNLIHQTIIDGDSSGSVISVTSGEDSTTQLSGFTIRNGADTLGGGIKMINSNLKISNCIITQNISYKEGGGIYCLNSNPKISFSTISFNSIFCENSDITYGGGICLINAGGLITDSKIKSNSITSGQLREGGGIYYHDSHSLIENLVIDNNFAENGGGICITRSDPTYLDPVILKSIEVCNNTAKFGGGIQSGIKYYITSKIIIVNSLINNNHSSNVWGGGGAFCWGDNTIFTNCTFTNNTGGHGIFLIIDSEVHLINTILSNNTPSELYILYVPGQNISEAFLSYCNVHPNGFAGYLEGVNLLEGNLNSNPLFTQTGNYPYMLSNGSPCVNTGTPDTTGLILPEQDLADNTRLYGGRIDIGAYENQNIWVGNSEFSDIMFSIEPNPFHNETFIRFESSPTTIVNIDLYDLAGRKIRNMYTGLTISENDKLFLDTSELEKGIYILVINTKKHTISKKVIKK